MAKPCLPADLAGTIKKLLDAGAAGGKSTSTPKSRKR